MIGSIVVIVASASLFAVGMADLCHTSFNTAYEIDGNWYCSAVQAIQYQNVGIPGSYNQVTGMDGSGACYQQPVAFSGPLAPLDEEVSLHFRGPIHLVQFAAYQPSSASQRRGLSEWGRKQRRNHLHNHRRQKSYSAPEVDGEFEILGKRQDMVYATIDGVLVSWTNNYFGPSATPAPTPAANAAPENVVAAPTSLPEVPASPPAPSFATPNAQPDSGVSSYGAPLQYTRIGYYESTSQTLESLTFLGHYGGDQSGIFDYQYGASLSYLSSDASCGAASPQILADMVVPSDTEFVIMTDRECNGDCGFVRPGSVAYHGFSGADKLFLMEFSMPLDGTTGFNGDMPSVWLLNAQIPRVVQYGDATCNCWTSGCGELDIMEVLSSGAMQAKSTIHDNDSAGDSDYIERPTTGTIKIAVIFDFASSIVHIQVLDDSTSFDTALTRDQVEGFMNQTPVQDLSVFVCSSSL